MITAQDALSFQPQKAGMNGYRAAEVDQFLQEVAETLDFHEKKERDLQNKVTELKQNETIIQATLVNAQKLAMQITEDSKAAAEQLNAEANKKAENAVAEAEKKSQALITEATAKVQQMADETKALTAKLEGEAREEAAKLVADAKAEAEQIKAQTAADMDHEKKLLDAMKTEVAEFRTMVLNMYKEQVTIIRDLPDMMPEEPVRVAPVAPTLPSAEPEAQQEAKIEAAEVENDYAAEGANGDLLKIMSDMDENEKRAAEAVDEVASMANDAPIEGQITLQDLAADSDDVAVTELQFNAEGISDDGEDDIPVMPVKKREGGFVISFDDDDE